MSYRSVFLNILLALFYSILIYIVGSVFSFTPIHLMLLLIVIVFSHQYLGDFLYRLLFRRYYFTLSRARQELEALNDLLNSAVRYHDITRVLYESFHTLFKGIPYAFYILEGNAYYLAQYEYKPEETELPYALDPHMFDSVDVTMTGIETAKLGLNMEDEQFLLASGLNFVLPFFGQNSLFAFLLIDTDKNRLFKEISTRALFGKIQKKAGIKLENSGLIIDLEKKNYETRKIIELSHKILSSLDTQNILDFILDTLKTIIDYDAAAIFLLEKSGKKLLNTGSRGYDADIMNNLYLKVGQGACGWVVKTRKIDVLDDVSRSRHYIQLRKQTRSQASIPLLFEKDVLGVLCLESDQPAFFKEDRVDILRLFANQTAIAIHNARQVEVQMAKQAFEHELINAGKVQQGLLPEHIPKIEKLKIVALNIPSKIVSGDLYDISRLTDQSAGLAIGDISGKGAPAALMMALILAGLRTQNKSYTTTCDLVYRLNELLCQTTIEGKYATFFYAIVNLETDSLIYTNGGHNPPLLFRETGEIISLDQGGIVLGFLPGYEYIQAELPFHKGDLLVAYTDGVTETLNSAEEEFGEKRLISLIEAHRHKSVHDIKENIIEELESFSGHEPPTDDITLVLCRHL